MSSAIISAVTPAATSSRRRLLDTTVVTTEESDFREFFQSVVLGQPKACDAACRIFRRTRSRLRSPVQPVYFLLAAGPTTCGKSEVAYRLAERFHGNRKALLKIDGSMFIEHYNLSRLTGASPNLAGYADPNSKDYKAPKPGEVDRYALFSQHNLNRSRMGSKCPYVIVLLDEWEKACKEFNNIMLGIMRDGMLILGNGESVDFHNVIFVATCNIGATAVEEAQKFFHPGYGGGQKDLTQAEMEEIINKHLANYAPPEFRARIVENGEVVIFNALTPEHISQICDLQMDELDWYAARHTQVHVEVDQAARNWLLDRQGGLATLNGTIKSMIIDAIDNELDKGTVREGDTVEVTFAGGNHLSFSVDPAYGDHSGRPVSTYIEPTAAVPDPIDADLRRALPTDMLAKLRRRIDAAESGSPSDDNSWRALHIFDIQARVRSADELTACRSEILAGLAALKYCQVLIENASHTDLKINVQVLSTEACMRTLKRALPYLQQRRLNLV
jgi:MoxR-like ATPase